MLEVSYFYPKCPALCSKSSLADLRAFSALKSEASTNFLEESAVIEYNTLLYHAFHEGGAKLQVSLKFVSTHLNQCSERIVVQVYLRSDFGDSVVKLSVFVPRDYEDV